MSSNTKISRLCKLHNNSSLKFDAVIDFLQVVDQANLPDESLDDDLDLNEYYNISEDNSHPHDALEALQGMNNDDEYFSIKA